MQTEYRKLGIGISMMVCVVVLGLGILASTSPLIQSPKEPQKPQEPQLAKSRPKINRISKTDALEVINTSVMNGFVKVALKNVSNKNVNGIQLAINGGILQIEFLDADRPENQKLLPSAIYEDMFPFDGGFEPVEIAVLAVTFDEKSSSGKTSLANEIFETRRGVKEQLTRFKSLLAEARKSPDADSIVFLKRLRAQAKDLPEGDGQESGSMRMGQIQAKQEIIQEIDFIAERLFRHPELTTVSNSVSEIETRHKQRLRTLETSTKQ
jgi:hypothetical protein